MSRARPAEVDVDSVNEKHEHVSQTVDGAYLFGVNQDGDPFYYDSERDRVIQRNHRANTTVEHDTSDGGVQSFIDDIEDRIGWDILGSDDEDDQSSGN